ncbi:MAG: spore coat protein [Clostridia bacterium]|nr:spore coat protein [Clostridia bacterium]
MNQQNMTDKEIMQDILSSQKLVTDTYNTYTNECVNQQLRTDFLNILREEHNIQQSVYDQMKTRGWYNPEQAEQQKVTTAYTKFSNIQQTL